MAKKPQSKPPTEPDYQNFTALEIAAIKGSRETVLRIARENFNPPLGTKRGNLILFSAAEKDLILAEIQDGPGNLKQVKGMKKNGSHKKGKGE